MQGQTTISSITQLPLKMIFEEMSYQDIIQCTRTPELRSMAKEFYKQDANQQSLIRLAVGEALDDLIFEDPTFINDFMGEYLVEKGLPKVSERQDYKYQMYKFIAAFSESELMRINENNQCPNLFKESLIQLQPMDVYDLVVQNNRLSARRETILESFCESAEDEIESIYHKQVGDFLEEYMYHPTRGFRNTMDLLSFVYSICKSVDAYKSIVNRIDQSIKSVDAYKSFVHRIDQSIKQIECIFCSNKI